MFEINFISNTKYVENCPSWADLIKPDSGSNRIPIFDFLFLLLSSKYAEYQPIFIIADLARLTQIANVNIDLIMKVVLKGAAQNVSQIDLKKFIEK